MSDEKPPVRPVGLGLGRGGAVAAGLHLEPTAQKILKAP
jgi:hypothetical protein